MSDVRFQAKDLKQYEREHKTIDELEDEDKFLLQLTKVERLEQKLNIMLYMTTFQETLNTITPVSCTRSYQSANKTWNSPVTW